MDVSLREQGIYLFDLFELDPIRRTLSRAGQRIQLRQLLFDALLYIVTHHSRVVGRDELFDVLWPGRIVDENNLGQTISALRRALREAGGAPDAIVTVPGRGFQLALPVVFQPTPLDLPAGGANWQNDPPSRGANAPPGPAEQVPSRLANGTFNRRLRALALLGALGVAGGLWWRLHGADQAAKFKPPPHSVAVMAFANLSGDPARDYLSDGLAGEVTDRLGRIGALHVAGRSSSFSFKQTVIASVPVSDIARRLNVGAVLQGSVLEIGRKLRISARLVDGISGNLMWSETYDAEPRQTTLLAGEIAAAVTAALQVSLSGADTAQLTLGGTTDPAALDAYLHGLQIATGGGGASRRPALAAFDQAIALDPRYAMAHLYRGLMLEQLTDFEDGHDLAWISQTQADAEASVRRAIAIAPNLGAAHAALAEFLEKNHWDFAGALAEISHALELAPGDAQTRMTYAFLQIAVGHRELAEAAASQAASLDPLSPRIYRELANVLIEARDFPAAQVALRHARQTEAAETPNDRYYAAQIELGLGHPAEVVRICAGSHDWIFEQLQAIADHALGRDDEAAHLLADLQQRLGDSAAMQYAEVYTQWGRTEEALKWLRTALRLRDPGMVYLRASPLLDPIMQTADFRDIERQMNFPP